MTCANCSAVEQCGRFCVGCGRRMPFSAPARPVRVVPRPAMDDTQPVLRLGNRRLPAVSAS
jgi:hypothetical protein